ncbi:conserved hypothetical protein [Leishmania major strain Friedlin]|uniref:Uncharacterized protein n=1 Tax=Leishmania major TaxID=5664 RepID=E9ADD6_LEIMA|nr:conserved hypothetical protein [Leishmania major strain Friedlin]CAG9576764.1 hypothetical_protein_-_conserved [Leishmania major strain Friedlin]CBZ12224.1 conserved hypothetical protein [Leishmania major strain Friedlin]|eukprot:XP_003721965.1 conserved hypothetical protein [Leishmania major strain Friedlin]
MLRRVPLRLARRKHGQTAWSPNNTSSGAAPTNGITAQEALQIAYRPMPPANTVEYEEDFGPNMMIHREFVSSRHRTRMASDISALAYSDVELARARQQLAGVMNRERRGALVGSGGEAGDRVLFNSDVDETTREVKSARFLFNEQRMRFCDRFQTFFRERIERWAAGDAGAGEDDHPYFSLMEACAVLHGCDTVDAREVYYRRFLGLDLDTLEAEEAALRARAADAAEVGARLTRGEAGAGGGALVAAAAGGAGGAGSATDVVQDIIDALPPLFPQPAAAEVGEASEAVADAPPARARAAGAGELPPATAAAPAHLAEDAAPLYKAYLAHARGESPVGSYDVTTLGAHAAHAERRRWRSLMDKIAAEDYHELTAAELEDAHVLNGQLHTVKFFDLKVGDTVREIVQLLERETGSSASGDRDVPVEMSPTHPERRV